MDKVPFVDQFNTVPLTCKRWNDLVKVVHLQKRTLVVWNENSLHDDPFLPMNRSLLAPFVSFDRFEKYLAILFNDTNSNELLITPADYWVCRTLDAFAFIQIVKHFPNLTHLSLAYVHISSETLTALLRTFQWQLEELFLTELNLETSLTQNRAELRQLANLTILPLIDGMPFLRQLSFSDNPLSNYIATKGRMCCLT